VPNENPEGVGAFAYNLRFPGQYFDTETGLHYNYYRDYDPNTGRYMQSDPIGLKGGLNTYAYVGDAPSLYSDRFGLFRGNILDFIESPATRVVGARAGPVVGALFAGLAIGTAVYPLIDQPLGDLIDRACEDKKKCLPATPSNIAAVLQSSSMFTLQPTVSASVIQSYVNEIEVGASLRPIYVDGNVIVDGNHRYIAGLLCKKPTSIQPWTAPMSPPRYPVQSLIVQP
jgi:RHS repeat-associated protein